MNYGKNSIYIDVTEILLKVALSTINQTKQYIYIAVSDCRSYCFLDFNKNIYQSTKETIQGFDAQYYLHREKQIDKNCIIQIHIGITNKVISTKLLLLLLSVRKIFNLMKVTFRRMPGMTIFINFQFLQFIFTIFLFLFIQYKIKTCCSLIIIIRTNHGQTEIVMQYRGILWHSMFLEQF